MSIVSLSDSTGCESRRLIGSEDQHPSTPSHEWLQSAFLGILPRLKEHGRIYFRDLVDPDRRSEMIAEMIAIAWKWFVRMAERGKDATQFASTLASYAAKAVRSGRRLCGQEKAKDVFSAVAQRRRGFSIIVLPEAGSSEDDVFGEALHHNNVTPVVDQVQFRMDFPCWRSTRSDRDRRLIDDLMLGERTMEMAQKYALSVQRVSELRHQFFDDWMQFCDGTPAPATDCE